MAFDKIEHFLTEQKLQFRLSSFAIEILTDDMFTFQETSLGPFLNEVFTAYYMGSAGKPLRHNKKSLKSK